ncbi:MAG: hypothetical protein ACYCXA_09585, partial [Actinomycetes bacterium]
MRRLMVAVGTMALVLGASAPAWAATSVSTGGGGGSTSCATTELPSANGGDNGLGNCGHNSSGGAAHTGDNG